MVRSNVNTSFRIGADQLAQITKRAKRAGMSRSAYMIAASLGELEAIDTRDKRFARMEQTLARIEDRLAEAPAKRPGLYGQ